MLTKIVIDHYFVLHYFHIDTQKASKFSNIQYEKGNDVSKIWQSFT